jgi:hypothetical protein
MNILREREYARFLEQVRHPQRRSWIIMNPTSIGDTALVCSLAREFVIQHGHGITMIVPPDHLPITQMFPDRFIRVLTADRSIMLSVMNNYIDANRFDLDVPFCGHPYDHGDCRGDGLFYLYKYPGRGGISLTDLFRHLLRLPWHARLDRPVIPAEWVMEAQEMAGKIGMERGRSVTLFPANSSPISQFPDLAWSTVVSRLIERGYRVFCNMKGGHFWPKTMPIAGSIPIEIPVHLALPLVSFAGRTISGPNGMQFLTMLGGRFEQMTVMAPVTGNRGDYQQNERTYHVSSMLAQYMCPEMCVGIPFAEYFVPHDASDEELKRHAIAVADQAVADQATADPGYIRRLGPDGRPFIEEQHDWLKTLIEPIAVA